PLNRIAQMIHGKGMVQSMAVCKSILSAMKPKINATIAAKPLSMKVVIANAVERSSGGTTADIMGSLEPFPGQLMNNAVTKQRMVSGKMCQFAVFKKRNRVNGIPITTEVCPMIVLPYLGLFLSAQSPRKPPMTLLIAVPTIIATNTIGAIC